MGRAECRVATLNIFHDLPTYRHLHRRCELIAEAIAACRPHLVGLQEVLRSTVAGDIGIRIRDAINNVCGGEIYRLDYAIADGAGEGDFSFDEGVAILSRIQPEGAAETRCYRAQVELTAEVGAHRYRLPDNRVALRRRFRLHSGARIEFYVTHLTDRPERTGGTAIRVLQARELAVWATSQSDPMATIILGGDFNDVPDSETVAGLQRAGFIDLQKSFGRGPGYTNDRNDIDLTTEHASHDQRIDYLMMRPANQDAPEIIEVRPFADQPRREPNGSWLWPSDHIGVIASLRL